MADFFSKSRSKKISSPEELDKTMTITSSSFWVAIAGGFLVILAALVWSVMGSLPQKITASGIFIEDQNAYRLSSEVNGIVESIAVKLGDSAGAGDVLYTLDTESLEKERKLVEERINAVKSITLNSTGDVSNNDTAQLLDIKSQIGSSGITVSQNEIMLELRKTALEEQKAKTAEAYGKMDEARKALEEYRTANAFVQDRYSKVLSAWNSLSQAKMNLTAAETVLTEAEEDVDWYSDYAESTDPKELVLFQSATSMYSSSVASYYTYKAQYDAAQKVYRDILAEYFPGADPAAAPDLQESVLKPLKEYNFRVEDLTYQYQLAQNEYSSMNSMQNSLEAEISSLSAQISAGIGAQDLTVSGYRNRFEAAKKTVLASLQEELDKYTAGIENNTVRTSISGVVSDILVSIGAMVTQGMTTVVLRQSRNTGSRVLCYVDASVGKNVKPGMDVKVYPATVNRQEYGNMIGKVVSVDEYLSTEARVTQQLGDENLGYLFTSGGPVLCVTCELEKDDRSLSGYRWSGEKGREVELLPETFVEVDIITEYKKPITMLIPYLKDKLSSKMQKDDSEDK